VPEPQQFDPRPSEIHNIRSRLLIPLVVTLVFLTLGFVAKSVYVQRERADQDVQRAADNIRHLFDAQLRDGTTQMLALGEVIMRDPALSSALARQDRAALLQAAKPLYDTLRTHNGITHFYFHTPGGACLLRVHHPELWGDPIARRSLARARATSHITTGNEQGPMGAFTLRTVFPWTVGGTTIGYLELGRDFDDVLAALSRSQPEVQLIVAVRKDLLDRAAWEKSATPAEPRAPWDRYPECVLLKNTAPAIPDAVNDRLAHWSDTDEMPLQTTVDSRSIQAIPITLSDLQGRQIGRLFVLRDTTWTSANATPASWLTAGYGLLLCSLLVALFYRFLGRVQRDLTRATNDAQLAVSQRERADHELAHNRERLALLEQQSAMAAELERAKEQAETANRAKSLFLTNVSHEVRTPMTAILGYAELLANPDQTPDQRQSCANVIRRNGDHLLTLINDILDLSKIEAGTLSPSRVPCLLSRVVDELAAVMRPRATEKGLAFDVECRQPLPATIRTDPARLRQVLVNLLGNAIKFTQAGSVKLVVRLEQTAPDAPARLCFDVIDTGVGLTPQQRESVFHSFAQADDAPGKKLAGSGLGLAIARSLARLLGGDVTVTSRPRHGSCFTAAIDVGAVAELNTTPEPTPHDPAAEKLDARILLAEDGRDNQLLFEHFLQSAGAEVTLAENGAAAVNHVLVETAAQSPFDLILMDMQMPYMDGYTATASLRGQGFTTPVIALTAHAMPEDRAKCLQAGCDDYLSKPVDRQTLLQAIKRNLRPKHAA
jgi:signal transduction histidine kinase/CheY-like chemotaxis protein